MTDKQKKAIKYIENMLEIKYIGNNGHDAWKFIHDNIDRARKCSFFEAHMSMPVFSANLGTDDEPDLDLKRDLSRQLLERDLQHGVSGSEAMTHFAENLFLENN